MRDDVPAALPFLSFLIALAAAPLLVSVRFTAVALVFVAIGLAKLERGKLAVAALTAAAALFVAEAGARRASEEAVVRSKHPSDSFVTVEAPIEGDWSARPHVNVLRSSRFRVAGHPFEAPISFYASFEPPEIDDEAIVRAEGFLRRDERGNFAMSVKSRRLLAYDGAVSRWAPSTWNRKIAKRLRRHAGSRPEEISMIEALVLGRGERLSDATRDSFKRGGTYHLLVFSGLQISLAAAAIALLLRWTGAPRISDLSLLAFAALAPAFIGPSASVSRASSGIALYAISRLARRPTSFENLWCVAAIVRLTFEPADLTDPAFHLTYAGAASLLFLGKPLARTRLRWIGYAFAAEAAIAPLTLFHFHQYALGGSLATIAMTPIVFVMLLLGAAFCATELPFLLDAIALLHSICGVINQAASPASGFFAAPHALAIAAGFGSAILAVGLLRGHIRTAAVIVSLLLPAADAIVRSHSARNIDGARISFLDVGQGDAILLQSNGVNVLIDGGGRSDNPRFGESTLLPLLADRGVSRIDIAVLTHAHPDHCGGLEGVIRRMRVGELWLNPRRLRGECAQRLLAAAADEQTSIRLVPERHTTAAGWFQLAAVTTGRRHRRAPENNASIVITASAFGRRAILTGDIEREAENVLSAWLQPAEILKVPHHGSRSSTGVSLLTATTPRWAIISCGRRNLFGHPHHDTLATLRNARIRTLRTDRHGTIEVTITPAALFVRHEFDLLAGPPSGW